MSGRTERAVGLAGHGEVDPRLDALQHRGAAGPGAHGAQPLAEPVQLLDPQRDRHVAAEPAHVDLGRADQPARVDVVGRPCVQPAQHPQREVVAALGTEVEARGGGGDGSGSGWRAWSRVSPSWVRGCGSPPRGGTAWDRPGGRPSGRGGASPRWPGRPACRPGGAGDGEGGRDGQQQGGERDHERERPPPPAHGRPGVPAVRSVVHSGSLHDERRPGPLARGCSGAAEPCWASRVDARGGTAKHGPDGLDGGRQRIP